MINKVLLKIGVGNGADVVTVKPAPKAVRDFQTPYDE
jgi:hypothetical protein